MPCNDDHIFDGDDSGLEEAMHEILHQCEAYCITYFYGDGGAPVYIKRISGDVDARRAAVYCQFMCEEWFGPEKMLTNLGIASLLITFYGFQHHHGGPYEKIDMYSDRAALRGEQYYELLSDKALHREKLREYMEPHVIT